MATRIKILGFLSDVSLILAAIFSPQQSINDQLAMSTYVVNGSSVTLLNDTTIGSFSSQDVNSLKTQCNARAYGAPLVKSCRNIVDRSPFRRRTRHILEAPNGSLTLRKPPSSTKVPER